MGTELTTTDRQAPWRQFADRALSGGSFLTATSTFSPTEREEARDWVLRELTALKHRTPEAQRAYLAKLEEALAAIAIKINPTIGAEQSAAWTRVVAQSLIDLPGRIALVAVRQALSAPIRFFPEVDGKVREIAADLQDRARLSLDQLARSGRPVLAPPSDENREPPAPLGIDETRALMAAPGGPSLVKIGITTGMISQADVDAIRAEQAEAA